VHDTESIVRLQAVLADALLAPDPAAFVRAAAARPDADPMLRAIDADGLRIAALLVAKLRFQNLMNASRTASEWFERDGAGFTAAFKRYHHEVPPASLDPWGERDQFDAWCARQVV
jgi:hypothetical protein